MTRGGEDKEERRNRNRVFKIPQGTIMCIHREESFENKLPLGSTSLQIASFIRIYIYTGALYLLGRKFEEYNRIAGSFPFVRNSMIRLHRWQNDVPDKLVEKMLETYTKGGDTAIENTLIEIVHRGRCDRGEKKVWGFHRGESTRGVQEIR